MSEKERLLKELDNRTTARGLLLYAKEYYSAYKLIQKEHPDITKFFAVKFYLLCHSLELVMKAILRQHGVSYKQLKSYGHDLRKLQSALYHLYKIAFDVTSHLEVELVNELYNNKEFEYHTKGSKQVPEITNLARTVHLLISKAHFDIVLDGDPRKLRT